MTYRIKNWSSFQHFKDRRPPWVKLYRELLDDIEWHELDPKAAKILVMIWLIASESDGLLPEVKQLAFRLRISQKDTIQLLNSLNHWLIQDDTNPISGGYQEDIPETETETEKDIADAVSPSKAKFSAVDHLSSLGVPVEIANDWLTLRKTKKAPVTETAIAGLLREATKAGWSLADALAKSCERGWTGFKADWVCGESVPTAADPGELITLPDGRQITRAQQDFLKRVMA